MLVKEKQFEIVKAAPGDSEDIRRMFESIRFHTAIDLQFRRGNDPYRSFQEEDDGAVVLLLKDRLADRTVGMGAASFHRVYGRRNVPQRVSERIEAAAGIPQAAARFAGGVSPSSAGNTGRSGYMLCRRAAAQHVGAASV